MKFTRNRLVAALVITLGVVTSVVFGTQSHAAIWSGQDCSTNAIIKCGVSSPSDLRAKYKASSELQALYGYFGVTSNAINGTMYSGIVTNSGDVIVNGKTVATNAMSVGRHQDDGTGCKGTAFKVGSRTYYQGTTACRFGGEPTYTGQAAYVMLSSDGQFVGAILKPCGNIIHAKPCPKPKPQTVVCNSLSAYAITNDMVGASKLDYNFTTKATAANGASIKSYTYRFGDGTTTTTGASAYHAYKQTGTYTATVTVNAVINGKAQAITSSACKVTVKPYKSSPKPPVVTCTNLTLVTIKDGTYNLKASAAATPGIAGIQTAGSISGYTYTVKDAKGNVVKTINKAAGLPMQNSESGNFTLNPGDYTAQVVVHSNAGDKTGAQCTVKICVPQPPKTIQVCRLSDHQIVTINENDYNSSKYSKDLSKCQLVQVCDTTTGTIVKVYPSQIDNERYITDLSKCYVQVCDTSTGTIVTVLKSEANGKDYTTDLSKCTKVQVCDLTTHQIVTVTKSEAENNSNYTSDTTQCQQVRVCDTTTGQVVQVYPSQIDNVRYTTDMTKCTPVTPPTPTPPAPTTPVELPHTGASDVIMSLFGAGSLIAAVSYYVASRRALS